MAHISKHILVKGTCRTTNRSHKDLGPHWAWTMFDLSSMTDNCPHYKLPKSLRLIGSEHPYHWFLSIVIENMICQMGPWGDQIGDQMGDQAILPFFLQPKESWLNLHLKGNVIFLEYFSIQIQSALDLYLICTSPSPLWQKGLGAEGDCTGNERDLKM